MFLLQVYLIFDTNVGTTETYHYPGQFLLLLSALLSNDILFLPSISQGFFSWVSLNKSSGYSLGPKNQKAVSQGQHSKIKRTKTWSFGHGTSKIQLSPNVLNCVL